MSDRFSGTAAGLESPASHGFAVTPSDSADLTEATRALYVGAEGDLSVELISGATVVLQDVPAGSLLPVRVRKVFATGSTASAIVGLV